ncbi:PREDICTED: uncharacterized protein LOC105571048, partial [Vollenhovia emeryi]|uniref:uncharacterized protein LOC105571048 n=1 Tax=Vollenhovia emeryi TaxID=411798 RepID=UPI0005F37169
MPVRAIERRPEDASVVLLSTDSEGEDMGGPWRTVRPGRRAKRRRLLSGGSPGGEISAAATIARASPPPPPLTPANYPELPRTPSAEGQPSPTLRPAAVRSRLSLPRTEETGGDTVGTDAIPSVAHPSAPANVRGVMGRPRTRGTRVQASGESEAPARLVSPIGHGRARRQRGRADAQADRAPRQPGPANAQRQRRRESLAVRDALVGRAEAVATIADLEEFAASVTNYFKEEAASTAGGEPSRASDRPRRTGRPRGRRGAEAEDAGLGGAQREGGRGQRRLTTLIREKDAGAGAVREVLQGPADLCQVPRQRVYQHFRGLYCGEDRLGDAGADAEPAEPATPEDVACLTDPFTEGEVNRRLRRMTNSAPGPDGLTYRDLRGADPGTRLLAALFNICVRLEVVPASWKTSNTVLVHKKGDRDDLDNWRPLALGDTMPKLFAAVLADRLTGWAVDQGKLSPAQKGFLRGEGCYEHNFALQEILTDARRRRRQAVPHATIRRAFVRAGVPRKVIEIWRSMYDDCTTRVNTVDGFTAPIPIRSGVRQGCPLSPITFDLAIDSVLRAATAVGAGYDLGGATWAVMAYADDIALVADTPEGMKRLLAAIEDEAASAGFRFNPAKCATLHIGAGRAGRVLPTRFVLQGQTVPCLAEGEPYRHLGVPTGFSVDQTPYSTIRGLLEDLQKVNRSLLTPWQRLEVVSTFLLPRLDFLLRGAAVGKRPLKEADLQIRRLAKSWLNLPQRASAEVVYLPPKWGGGGLLPLCDLADSLTVAHAFRILTAGDAAVRGLAWSSLRGVVQRRIGRVPEPEDIAAFLSGSMEGRLRGGGEASFWSDVRNAGRRQSERLSVRWRWVRETGEMTVGCRGLRGATVTVPPGARSQVTRMRSAVSLYYRETLVRKPDQGKVFEVSSRHAVSNHFMRGGSFTRFADWRFVHRARLDVLPLNGAIRWGSGDRRCRRCGAELESLPHVLGHCGVHAAAIQLRHDAVLHRLWKACRLPGEVRVNRRVEGVSDGLTGLRPDLVIRHEPSKCVVILDVTVPFENRAIAFEEARARKVIKYSALAEELRSQGYRVEVAAFVVGALGSWDPANEGVLDLLRVSKRYAGMMRRLMVSDTIRWSRDIYVEHVSGVRQYGAPPPPPEDGSLAEPPQAIRRRWPEALRGDDCGASRTL